MSYENNKLIIDKDEIFKIDGQAIPYDELAMTLYYRQGSSPVKISEFKPVFPNLDELKVKSRLLEMSSLTSRMKFRFRKLQLI